MTTQQGLHAIAIDVVGHYNSAARNCVTGYRNGSRRLLAGIGGGFEQVLERAPLPLVPDALKSSLRGGEQRLVGEATGAISRMSERTAQAVDRLAERAIQRIKAFDEMTAWADEMFVVDLVRRVNMPAAKLSLEVASRVDQASHDLAARIGGEGSSEDTVADEQPTPPKARARRAPRARRTA